MPSQCCGYSRRGSAEGFGWQSHPGCLAQGVRGSWPLHAALPESRAAERRKRRPADVTDTYACHQQKGQENNLEEAATCFLRQDLGDGAPLRIATHSELSLSACHCLTAIATKNKNKISIVIKVFSHFNSTHYWRTDKIEFLAVETGILAARLFLVAWGGFFLLACCVFGFFLNHTVLSMAFAKVKLGRPQQGATVPSSWTECCVLYLTVLITHKSLFCCV